MRGVFLRPIGARLSKSAIFPLCETEEIFSNAKGSEYSIVYGKNPLSYHGSIASGFKILNLTNASTCRAARFVLAGATLRKKDTNATT